MKKICFIINAAGSMVVAKSVIEILRNKFQILIIFSDALIANKNFKSIKEKKIYYNNKTSSQKALKILKKISPDLVFCGSNGNNFFELNFSEAACLLGIKTMTILDSWSYPLKRVQKKNKKKFNYLPLDLIGVPDIKTYQILSKKRIYENKLFFAGLPQVGRTVVKFNSKNEKKIDKKNFNILYISTPNEVPKKNDIKDGNEVFFNQKEIINTFLNVFNKIQKNKGVKINIFIKPHPSENKPFYVFINKQSKKYKQNLKITLDKEKESFQSLLNKDCVIGITSMMLIESIECNKPTISLQFCDTFIKKKNYFKKIKNLTICKNEDLLENHMIKIFNAKLHANKLFKSVPKKYINFNKKIYSRINHLVDKR